MSWSTETFSFLNRFFVVVIFNVNRTRFYTVQYTIGTDFCFVGWTFFSFRSCLFYQAKFCDTHSSPMCCGEWCTCAKTTKKTLNTQQTSTQYTKHRLNCLCIVEIRVYILSLLVSVDFWSNRIKFVIFDRFSFYLGCRSVPFLLCVCSRSCVIYVALAGQIKYSYFSFCLSALTELYVNRSKFTIIDERFYLQWFDVEISWNDCE